MTHLATPRRRWLRSITVPALVAGALAFASPALAPTYFVSPTGADTNSGTSLSTPWRTVAKVNAVSQEKMGAATAGMPLPPGLKLPF